MARAITSADRIALDIVSVQGLQEAGQRAGLHPHSVHQIPPTEEHIGSQVVILGALSRACCASARCIRI